MIILRTIEIKRINEIEMDKIVFETEEGTEEFYVLEETRINNCNYLLVADSMDDEAQALILKDVSAPEDTEAVYVPVEDDIELDALAGVFAEAMGDVSFEK